MIDGSNGAEHFLDLIRRSRRGKFKIYIGMMAGVGKTYRMLQEAHELLNNGIDVQEQNLSVYSLKKREGIKRTCLSVDNVY